MKFERSEKHDDHKKTDVGTNDITVEDVENVEDVKTMRRPVDDDVEAVENVETSRCEMRGQCDRRGQYCTTHEVKMLMSTTRRKSWTKGKNGLYRNVYRCDKTFTCPVINPEKITKPLESAQGEIKTIQSLEESKKAGRLGKRDRRGSFLSD